MTPILHPVQVLEILRDMTDEEAGELLAACGDVDNDEFCVRASAELIKWRASHSGGGVG